MAIMEVSRAPKAQSFGGKPSRRTRRLSPALESHLRYVLTDAETDAGVRSISMGQGSEARATRHGAERDICDGDVWGAAAGDGFIKLFAQERYLLQSERDPSLAARRRETRRALLAIAEMANGPRYVGLLYRFYGPRQPGTLRDEFGDLGCIVDCVASVEERRVTMARRLAEERVSAAELAAFEEDSKDDVFRRSLAERERQIRKRLEDARVSLRVGDRIDAKLRDRIEASSRRGKDVAKMTETMDRRARLGERRQSRIARMESRLAAAVEIRRGCERQGPARTFLGMRDIADSAIRASADREVSRGNARRDLLAGVTEKKGARASVVARLRREADRELGAAEDALTQMVQSIRWGGRG